MVRAAVGTAFGSAAILAALVPFAVAGAIGSPPVGRLRQGRSRGRASPSVNERWWHVEAALQDLDVARRLRHSSYWLVPTADARTRSHSRICPKTRYESSTRRWPWWPHAKRCTGSASISS